jgi:hypothetical protein
MSNEVLLVRAMADRCREMIDAWDQPALDQPNSLRPEHLGWMCRQISAHAEDWPPSKVHRWLGFIQGAMIANHMLSLAEAKRMFDEAKNAFGSIDQDLADHLDPDSSFDLDIGGEG